MTSTRGRKPKPLPPSVAEGMVSLGFVRREQDEWIRPVVFRHKKHPALVVELSAMNLPGSTEVLAKTPGRPVRRLEVDVLLVMLNDMVRRAESPVQVAR